jgi:chorismate mutase / prephenate dehydratase
MKNTGLVYATMEDEKLEKLRQEIDAIDSEMLELLAKRIAVVEKVGEYKAKENQAGRSIIRPGREAKMIRKVSQFKPKEKVGSFPNATVAYIWRLIIAASINIEENTKISVNAGQSFRESFWLAKEYFGPFTEYILRDSSSQVLRDLLDGSATAGVVALDEHDLHQAWWTRLSRSESSLKVFARVPFVKTYNSKRPALVAIGNVVPEDTGDDTSLWMVSTEEHIPNQDIEMAMSNNGLNAKLLHKCRTFGVPNINEHLCNIEGFVSEGDPRIVKSLQAVNSTVRIQHQFVSATYLGSYANPILIPDTNHES